MVSAKYNENTRSVVNVVSKAISKPTYTLDPARQFVFAALLRKYYYPIQLVKSFRVTILTLLG